LQKSGEEDDQTAVDIDQDASREKSLLGKRYYARFNGIKLKLYEPLEDAKKSKSTLVDEQTF
jgi:hypothetical protein